MNFKILLVLSVALVIECRSIAKDKLTEAEDVIQSIPKFERKDFMAYALGHGFMEDARFENARQFPFPTLLKISKKLENKFKSLKTPKNFTSDLYLFVKSTFHLSGLDMFALILRRKICFPNGRCIDLENIGEMCCPF